jgi:hypothetical protein
MQNRKVINATEGGLEIKGIEHKTLWECVDQYMKQSYPIRIGLLSLSTPVEVNTEGLKRALIFTKKNLDNFIKLMERTVEKNYTELSINKVFRRLTKSHLNHYFGKLVELRLEYLEYAVKYQNINRFDGVKGILNELNEICRVTREYCLRRIGDIVD